MSEVLGHKDVAITLDRYSHAMPTMQVEAMGRLDAILGRSPLEAANDISGVAPEEPALWRMGSLARLQPGACSGIRAPIRVLRAVDGQRRSPI